MKKYEIEYKSTGKSSSSIILFCLYPDSHGSTLTVPKDIELDYDSVDGPSSRLKEKPVPEWQSKVLFALNLSRLDVSTNMGNIMGQSV